MGSLVAVPLAYVLAPLDIVSYSAVVMFVIFTGVWAGDVADKIWGTHDNGRIVIDEVAGLLITVTCIDRTNWALLLIGFVIFRVLDIAKPPPIKQIDKKLSNAWGVMLDDVMAGIFGLAIMVAITQMSLW